MLKKGIFHNKSTLECQSSTLNSIFSTRKVTKRRKNKKSIKETHKVTQVA